MHGYGIIMINVCVFTKRKTECEWQDKWSKFSRFYLQEFQVLDIVPNTEEGSSGVAGAESKLVYRFGLCEVRSALKTG